MTTVGILGGGQLARMMALVRRAAGPALPGDGYRRRRLRRPVRAADRRRLARRARAERFASKVDVATFDFENVPAESAHWLTEHVTVFPNPRALAVAQDRLAEKTLFRELGIPVPDFAEIASREDLDAAIARLGTPCILKTRRLGYDGKGQFRTQDARRCRRRLERAGRAGHDGRPDPRRFRRLRARAQRRRRARPRWRIPHLAVDRELARRRCAVGQPRAGQGRRGVDGHGFRHAEKLAEAMDYVGVFALELFCRDGVLLANELAPRVHNSGHWTIEGSETSQFQNHLRAVLGLPLGDTRMVGLACMLNWIGDDARCRGGAARTRRSLARLRQGAARWPQGRSRHVARRFAQAIWQRRCSASARTGPRGAGCAGGGAASRLSAPQLHKKTAGIPGRFVHAR